MNFHPSPRTQNGPTLLAKFPIATHPLSLQKYPSHLKVSHPPGVAKCSREGSRDMSWPKRSLTQKPKAWNQTSRSSCAMRFDSTMNAMNGNRWPKRKSKDPKRPLILIFKKISGQLSFVGLIEDGLQFCFEDGMHLLQPLA